MENNKKHLLVAGIAALLMSSSMGLNINTIGVFLQPIAIDLNESIGAVSTHSMLLMIGVAFGSFMVIPALKRYNIRLIILMSALIMAISTFVLSFATHLWVFNLLGFIRGLAASFSGMITIQLLINNWFIAKHGFVTSFVLSFSGVAGALFSPLLASVINSQGWRLALIVQAVLFLLLSLPGILITYHLKPEDEGLKPYGAKTGQTATNGSEAKLFNVSRKPLSVRSTTFIATLMFSFLIPMITAISQHLAGIGLDFGFAANTGALMISACMIGNILFKLIIGVLSDTLGIIKAVSTMAGIVILGLTLLLITDSNSLILIASFFVGAIYSMASVAIPLLINQFYSPLEFMKVFPLVNFVASIGGAIAITLYGISYDFSGGYILSIVASIVVVIAIMVLILVANQSSISRKTETH